jgi:hypothetical protein
VASYLGVIVATQITLDPTTGTISGNVAERLVLRLDNPSGYQPDPGVQSSGVLVAIIH